MDARASWYVPGFGAGAAFFLAFGGRFIAQVPFGICVSTRAGCCSSDPMVGTGFCARHAAIFCHMTMQAGWSGCARDHHKGHVLDDNSDNLEHISSAHMTALPGN